MSERIDEARNFVKEKHKGQKRKNGDPYYTHPLTVQSRLETKGFNEEYQLAGLFHDLLEDTDATEEEIKNLSNESVLEAVKLLTKQPEYSKEEYINNILKNPIAKAVKTEDRIHNLLDSLNAGEDFIKRYLTNTKDFYLGKFSEELDVAYEMVSKRSGFTYYYDSSIGLEISPIYRTNGESTWRFNKVTRQWVIVSAYDWLDLGDNATPVDYEYLKENVKNLS